MPNHKYKNTGPRNIGLKHLIKYKFPVQAIASILHRISGVILFLFIPVILYTLDKSLNSSSCFNNVLAYFNHPVAKFFIWFFVSALIYHLLAGIKHVFMDIGLFEEKTSSQVASYFVIILSTLLIILLGVWLW
tara:strand:+ start:35 stop:433 length:399 start_codon:yes stop_codon:yes gene_type:complete